jgi:hypothetical protein
MRVVLLRTILGLLFTASGIQTIYIYVSGLDKGSSILLLIFALVLIGIGIYFLTKAGKSDATVFVKLKNFRKKRVDEVQVLEQALEKNTQLTKKWGKTVEKRDRLKMLEISTAAAADVNE